MKYEARIFIKDTLTAPVIMLWESDYMSSKHFRLVCEECMFWASEEKESTIAYVSNENGVIFEIRCSIAFDEWDGVWVICECVNPKNMILRIANFNNERG